MDKRYLVTGPSTKLYFLHTSGQISFDRDKLQLNYDQGIFVILTIILDNLSTIV